MIPTKTEILIMLLLVLGVILISGCASKDVVYKTVEVKVPVAQPCVSKDQIPPMFQLETKTVDRNDPVGIKAKALVIDFKRLLEDDITLRQLLGACVND